MSGVKLPIKHRGKPIELASSFLESLANWVQSQMQDGVASDCVWNASVTGMLRLATHQLAFGGTESTSPSEFLKVHPHGATVDFKYAPGLRLVEELIASLRVEDTLGDIRFANAHLISTLYEVILNMVCATTTDGGSTRFELTKVDKSKKRSGSFYTPPHLARLVVERALTPVVLGKTVEELLALKIVDPAMGAGIFLVEALRFLENAVSTEIKGKTDWRLQLYSDCLYGVDLDPLAVEAARCALWLAAGNSNLEPITSTSKLRVGNSLVGARMEQAGTFPVEDFAKMDGGSRRAALILERNWAESSAIEQQKRCVEAPAMEQLKSCAVSDAKEQQKSWAESSAMEQQKNLAESPATEQQKSLNRYCALWYMSAQERRTALEFENDAVSAIADSERFFHWQFEFPEVFRGQNGDGFDVVLGNPPWEIEKPNSREFFGMVDSRYWALSKQEALLVQDELLAEDEILSKAWEQRQRSHQSFMHWVRHAFRFQGRGDVNLYKLFIEQSYYLARDGGTVSLLTPSGIYSDSGTKNLRRLLLNETSWSELIGFDNRDGTFAIHRSFKYCVIVFRKGGNTSELKSSFSNLGSVVSDLEWCRHNRQGLSAISPKWMVIPELQDRQVYSIIEKIQSRTKNLGEFELGGVPIRYVRELDMTLDSKRFRCRSDLDSAGFIPDVYGNWLSGNWGSAGDTGNGIIRSASLRESIAIEDVLEVFCPLYEGRMIGQFDCNEKRWVEGKGRQAVWHRVEADEDRNEGFGIGPQYLVPLRVMREKCIVDRMKIGFLAVGSPTNARTMISTCLTQVACGNSVPVLILSNDCEGGLLPTEVFHLALSACLNSFVFDFVLRNKMAGNNLNFFVIEESPLPLLSESNAVVWSLIGRLSSYLSLSHLRFSGELVRLGHDALPLVRGNDRYRRLLRARLEALIAFLYGVDLKELELILSGSSNPSPKEFFRVDKHLPQPERMPAVVLSQFARLIEIGLELYLEESRELLQGANSAPVERGETLQEHANLLKLLLTLD
ncbi:MAG: SAM-dependent methyltransferase [Candidatus Obscuribacterales bacterium]|nr:SAM-dependent methyltransferase [Candidatus Obscuribacterales bacterium]